MFLQTLATLLPLAQTAASTPNPSAIAGRLLQSFFADPHTQAAMGTALLAAGVSVLINILAWWVASKVMAAADKATFFNALKLWMLSILIGIVLVLLLVAGLAGALFVGQKPVTFLVIGIWALLVVLSVFVLPMRVYSLGFLRTVGFLLITLIVSAAGQTALSRTLGYGGLGRSGLLQQMQSLPPDERQRYLREVFTGAPTDPLDAALDRLSLPTEHAKPFTERQAALKAIFTQLDARFKALPKDDPSALENYQRIRARYEQQLALLRDEFAASQAAATPMAR